MTREETIAVATAIVLVVALLGGVYENLWTVNSVLLLVPYFLLAGMIAVLVWGFRGRIERRSKPTKPSKGEFVGKYRFYGEPKPFTVVTTSPEFPTEPYVPHDAEPPPSSEPAYSMGHMHVKIGTVEIREPDLTMVALRGIGFPGFEFKGVAPEAKAKQIADRLEDAKVSDVLPCEAVMKNGKRISGYGKLEQFDSQAKEDAPAVYRFSGVVTLLR